MNAFLKENFKKILPVNLAFTKRNFHCKMVGKFEDIPEVQIDGRGTFKYILIKSTNSESKDEKITVYGNKAGAYHADLFDEFVAKYSIKGVKSVCTGGGRILHEPSKQFIKVYGYSQGFGRADHELAVKLLNNRYTDYQITWSNDGY